MAVALLVFNSCQKEEMAMNKAAQVSHPGSGSERSAGSARDFFCDPDDDDAPGPCGPATNCDASGSNCIDVGVAVRLEDLVTELDLAIDNGSVPLFFKDVVKAKRLFPAMELNLLLELQNATTTVKRVNLADPGKILYTLHDASTGELRK